MSRFEYLLLCLVLLLAVIHVGAALLSFVIKPKHSQFMPSSITSQCSRMSLLVSKETEKCKRSILCSVPHKASIFTSINGTATNSTWTRDDLLDFASKQGMILSFSTLGPGFRVVARSSCNASDILAYAEGFVRPSGRILHLDKVVVFHPVVERVRKTNTKFTGGSLVFGIGMYLGYLCFLHGQDKGCKVAEFLAIDDNDQQHRKLMRLYKYAGFRFVKYVGDDWKDIPDRLIWGGCGSLLRNDIGVLLSLWSRLFEKERKRNGM